MLTPTHTFALPPFIVYAETGFVTAQAALRYCRVRFNAAAFHVDQFALIHCSCPTALLQARRKRQAEYLAGRYAAHMLLRAYGCEVVPGCGVLGEPLWPPGWHGSISHSDTHAIALLSADHHGLTPGVDIEPENPSVLRATAHLFTSCAERQLLVRSSLSDDQALLLAFSAKESLYKALAPQIGRRFGFSAARLVHVGRHTMMLALTEALSPALPQGSRFSGQYRFADGAVITLVVSLLTPPCRTACL